MCIRDRYKLKLKTYRKKCNIESQKDTRRIQETIENEQKMAKHVNQMAEVNSPKLSTLSLQQGHQTDPGEETGRALLEAHYPGIKPKKGTRYDRNKSMYSNPLQEKYDWINIDRLKSYFKASKQKNLLAQTPLNPVSYTHLTLPTIYSV